MNTLEILAIILISLAVIKIIIYFIHPNFWYAIIDKLYAKPAITSLVALILAISVLYLLIISGVTITEILAVSLFIVLIIAMGLAKNIKEIMSWVKEKNRTDLVREFWQYLLIWLLLLALGVGEILAN